MLPYNDAFEFVPPLTVSVTGGQSALTRRRHRHDHHRPCNTESARPSFRHRQGLRGGVDRRCGSSEDLADRSLLMSELRQLSVERLADMVAGFYYLLEDEDES